MSKRTALIRILDEVNCVILNIHPDDVMTFYTEYGLLAPGHFHSPKFQLGIWDGRIRFFSKTGKTYNYLLRNIIQRLIQMKYAVEVDDKRQGRFFTPEPVTEDFFKGLIDPDTGEPVLLRPYQVNIINALLKNGSGIGIAGTGAGKTLCTAAIAKSYENAGCKQTCIIVPDKNLNSQTAKEYAFFGLDVGRYSGEVKDLNHKHIVSTWQALKNNPTILNNIDVIIVDEAHGTKGNILLNLLVNHANHIVHRFGVTGTMPKEQTDALSVNIALGDILYEIPAHELIEQGYLSKVHIDIFEIEANLQKEYNEYKNDLTPIDKPLTYSQFKNAYLPDYESERNYIRNDKSRQEWISTKVDQLGKRGNVLCLVSNIPYGKKLTNMIPGAIFVYGKDEIEDREKIYELFKHNDNLVVIANVQIASTGLNIKRIFNLVTIDIGKSFVRVIQSIGRGLRKAHDKDTLYVADISSDLKHSHKHTLKRIAYYNEAKYPNKKIKIKL